MVALLLLLILAIIWHEIQFARCEKESSLLDRNRGDACNSPSDVQAPPHVKYNLFAVGRPGFPGSAAVGPEIG